LDLLPRLVIDEGKVDDVVIADDDDSGSVSIPDADVSECDDDEPDMDKRLR
jgi:hypothetical protein